MTKPVHRKRLAPTDPRPEFDCHDKDLNEFFSIDSKISAEQLLSVTYTIVRDDEVLAFFSVSNDSIKRDDLSRSKEKKILKTLPPKKRYRSLPAVKIGRLAIAHNYQNRGIGRALLDNIKMWFTHENKTGCRYIIVDAYNKPKVIRFYQKNGFEYLLKDEEKDETRLMFFDLITFRK